MIVTHRCIFLSPSLQSFRRVLPWRPCPPSELAQCDDTVPCFQSPLHMRSSLHCTTPLLSSGSSDSLFIVYPSSVGNILSSAECHPNLSDKLMLLFLPFWLLGTHYDFCTRSYFLVYLFPPLRTLEVFKGKATHSRPSVRCVGLGRTGAQRAGKEWILQPKIETGKVGFSLQCANAHLFIK